MNKPSPIDWKRIRAAREAEVDSLRELRLGEVAPSRRDFTQFIRAGRDEVAVIGAIRRRDPWSGQVWAELDVTRIAAALDDTEVAALAVSTEPLFHGGRLEDMRTAANAATAPLLRDDYLVHPLQIFHSRLHGADACIVPVAWVASDTLAELVRTASSLHMTMILAVFTPEEVEHVMPFDKTVVGIWAPTDGGEVDLERLARIAGEVSRRRAVMLLGDVLEPRQWGTLRGLVDAAIVARLWMDETDPASALARLVDG